MGIPGKLFSKRAAGQQVILLVLQKLYDREFRVMALGSSGFSSQRFEALFDLRGESQYQHPGLR